MKILKISKKILKNAMLFGLMYFALYGTTWLLFLKYATKSNQLQSTYTIQNLLELSKQASSYATDFSIVFMILYLLISNFKFLIKQATIFVKRTPKVSEIA